MRELFVFLRHDWREKGLYVGNSMQHKALALPLLIESRNGGGGFGKWVVVGMRMVFFRFLDVFVRKLCFVVQK